MKPGRLLLPVPCVALLSTACDQTIPTAGRSRPPAALEDACAVVAAANARGDQTIAALQARLVPVCSVLIACAWGYWLIDRP